MHVLFIGRRLEHCSGGSRQRIRKNPITTGFIHFGDFMNSHLQRYGALCKPLLRNNYQPIPVVGKKPIVNDWRSITITSEQVKRWSSTYPHSGVGLRTGQGEYPIFAADFDFYDATICDQLVRAFQEKFGQSLMRIGEPPKKLLLYRAQSSHPKIASPYWVDLQNPIKPDGEKRLQRFELLGNGQQFVAFGKHPKIGTDYVWVGGDPLQVPAQDLSVLDPREVASWIADTLPLLLPKRYQLQGAAPKTVSYPASSFATDPLDIPNEETISDLAAALAFLTAEDSDNYETWIQVGHALKTLVPFGLEEQANNLYHAFASKSDRYDYDETQIRWDDFQPTRTSYKVIFSIAQSRGWTNPKSKEGLRQEQRELNRKIGEGNLVSASNEILTLDEMLDRLVYNVKGQMISDRQFPQHAIKLADARVAFAASRCSVQIKTGDGVKTKEVYCLEEFIRHPKRPTTADRTFIAGADVIVRNEEGVNCFNTFRPFARRKALELENASLAQPFIEHVEWLFSERADHFLNWLAHIEQQPGVLPQTAWLHIANRTGLGRNWISSVLVRVWPGYVASNFDLVGSLNSSFNGQLSHKLLAQVDELNEAHQAQGKWSFSERLKSIINPEYRDINNKYGVQVREKNACRFLMFSNHVSAIPIEESDRRIEVVICNKSPQTEEYYKMLYALLQDEMFIASVARFLMDRDITSFNPGATALATAHKQSVTEITKSEADEAADYLVANWPHDVIPTYLVSEYLPHIGEAALRHIKTRSGIKPYTAAGQIKSVPTRIDGGVGRLLVIRNYEAWSQATLTAVKEEAKRSIDLLKQIKQNAGFGACASEAIRAYLDDRVAQ